MADLHEEFYALPFETVADVKRGLEIIAECRDDDEAAHGMEDRLREGVLKAIFTGKAVSGSEMAGLALETTAIEFSRWCT